MNQLENVNHSLEYNFNFTQHECVGDINIATLFEI